MLPEIHTDTIRQISKSTYNPLSLLSAGFDGNLCISDLSRLYEKNEKPETNLFQVKEVIGSVSWSPKQGVCSCTTDTGIFHVFDVRTEKKSILIHDTKKSVRFK